MAHRRSFSLPTLIACLLSIPIPALAADLTVCASGCTYNNSQLQTAINAAVLGDTIILEAGVQYDVTLTYPDKGAGTDYITITSNADPADLPPVGHRSTEAYSAFMPKLRALNHLDNFGNNFPAGSHHWRFIFIEFLAVPNGNGNILQFGNSSARMLSELPHHLIVDRCNFLATPQDGQKSAIAFNGAFGEIRNSTFRNIMGVAQDAQCIAGNDAIGPLIVDNNFLECAAENIIFGGSDPTLTWRMTTTGNVSTTGASVVLADPTGRVATDLAVGDLLGIDIDPDDAVYGEEFVHIATIANADADSVDLTWTPALSAPPEAMARAIRHDKVIKNLTVTRNVLTKNEAWRTTPILGTPTNPNAALVAGGTLPTTQKCYKLVAMATGYQSNTINSLPSSEVCATPAGGNLTVRVTFTAGTLSDSHRLWRGTTPGGQTEWAAIGAGIATIDDTGGLSWTTATIPSSGQRWVVKTSFELKAADGWLIEGNVMGPSWEDSNSGARQGGGWFKSENQANSADEGCATCTTRNGIMRYNIFKGVHGAWSFQGRYQVNGTAPRLLPAPMMNVYVHDNLVKDCSDSSAEAPGQTTHLLLIQNGVQNITIDHNTFACEDAQATMAIDTPIDNTGFVFTNNMIPRGTFGVFSDVGEGTPALEAYAPGYVFLGNAIGGPQSGNFSGNYPSGNFYPTLANWQAAFTTYTSDGVGADFTIANGHQYENAGTDGEDIGANIAAVLAATATTESGIPAEQPPAVGLPSVVRRLAAPGQE